MIEVQSGNRIWGKVRFGDGLEKGSEGEDRILEEFQGKNPE